MRVLFTSPILEHPATGGPQLRIENSIKALGKLCELHVVSRAALSERSRSETERFFAAYATRFIHIPRVTRKPHGHRFARLVRGALRKLTAAATREDARFLLEYVNQHAIDVVWLGYGNVSFPLIRYMHAHQPQLKMVCDTDSVWSRFVLREVPFVTGLRKFRILCNGRRKELEERSFVALCSVTTAVSEVDAYYYRGLASDAERVRVFRNVIDIQSYEARPGRPPGFRNPSIYLAGTFGYSPMDSAARWVLDKVFPLLLERHPDLHFYLVGKNSDTSFGHLNGSSVTTTGRLESVLPYLMHTDVALVPLMFESGTRFKILEAGACGIPLVSTTLGAEGIPVVDGKHILVADEPRAFADAILRLLEDKDLATRLASQCQQLVRQEFSVEALVEDGRAILEYLRRQ